MSQTVTDGVRWTTTDIDLLADNEVYEIVDGELFMTRAPHWRHQRTCGRIFQNLILGQSLVVWEKLASLLAFCLRNLDNVMPDGLG